MKVAIVMAAGDSAAIGGWLAGNDLASAELERWTPDAGAEVAGQLLDALVAQWRQTPADIVLFPAGALADELATRLAWRLQGRSVCQVQSLNAAEGWVTKPYWGNALTATLEVSARPLCLSLARQPGGKASGDLPCGLPERRIVPAAQPDWLTEIERVERTGAHPLATAERVLVVGQGGEEADAESIAALAQNLGAEAGYSRARVMNGGHDADRLVGISGHLLAPDICIVAGASGAAALMAGVRDSRFIVAINHDAGAPVFSQADVGIVDEWLPVLEALAASAHD
ncbi:MULTISPECIES: electron transfer flavoprotein subunit alpha/FixB family protein [Raoultella]|uniref:electron transfer flavoprotein subunit alpha/FixB family protein n=1 Tax=Raoultella TaxID=160674 RepID=UPI002166C75A|nr:MULTISPECIES: electron transfer flavoprotein subunit alpha/FixB family protein [Raoultella]MCS4272941.1 electron transfer flavoprotein alpha subunit [Raoultella sp. BIGb0132]MCS4289687.1 electron transfer flavoprotein alpha subunit [Raoultella terrigena]